LLGLVDVLELLPHPQMPTPHASAKPAIAIVKRFITVLL
jgi:hypothetical protein